MALVTYVRDARTVLMENLPGLDDRLVDLYTLLALTTGEETSLEDVHDAWSLWRSPTHPDHHSIVPFAELTVEVQELDRKYMDAIHATAAKLKTGRS